MRNHRVPKIRAPRGLQHFRVADITVHVPFEATADDRIALLRAASVPLNEAGEVHRGLLFERACWKPTRSAVLRWFDEGSIGRTQADALLPLAEPRV